MGQPAKTTGQYGNQAQKTTPQTTLPQTNDTRESGTLGLLGFLVGLFGLALTRKRKQQ
ncbi:LPXTG cell wall anchor domain-containing protein [Secundilactobacillus paracollinoides]|nr:LPXTG cell wall anchor domain-containing protein [Secundilactobacillus paracollinoides]